MYTHRYTYVPIIMCRYSRMYMIMFVQFECMLYYSISAYTTTIGMMLCIIRFIIITCITYDVGFLCLCHSKLYNTHCCAIVYAQSTYKEFSY